MAKSKGKKFKGLTELQAMDKVYGILDQVAGDARPRVISWVSAKFGIRSLPQVQFSPNSQAQASQATQAPKPPSSKVTVDDFFKKVMKQESGPVPNLVVIPKPPVYAPAKPAAPAEKVDLKDIAKVEKGRVKLVVKDLKAEDEINAVSRIAYLMSYATQMLLGKGSVPVKEILEETKKYKAFNKETAGHISKNNFLKDGGKDVLYSKYIEGFARVVVKEIRDNQVRGAWGSKGKGAKAKKGPVKRASKKK